MVILNLFILDHLNPILSISNTEAEKADLTQLRFITVNYNIIEIYLYTDDRSLVDIRFLSVILCLMISQIILYLKLPFHQSILWHLHFTWKSSVTQQQYHTIYVIEFNNSK